MPYNELTYKYLNRLAENIKRRLPSNSDVANSLEIKENQLLGNDYIYYLDQGRGPGRFPPVQTIRDWVRKKLGISNEKENKQVSFLVGKKIANLGTEIFRDKSKGIQLKQLVNEMMDELIKELPDEVAAEALTWL